MRRSGLILSRKFVIGILLWTALLIDRSEALRGSAVVLQAKIKAAEQKETDEETNNGPTANVTKPQLTGIPQIDYVLDPNLPRELNGHNLTDYPFYNALPEDINFKCDGLHDGFYASVPHKCQVYHHCLYGTRYDFLCANYTAFDQKTFICHFVSEVDCDNSPKYFKRNEALYKEATTASTTTSTTTTTAAPSTTTAASQSGGSRHGNGPRRRRPYRRRRPMYEYYYDDEEYADADYYDDEVASLSHRRTPYRKHNKESYPSDTRDTEADYDSQNEQSKPPPVRPSTSGSNGGTASVFERPRTPPKIRRPVPKSERDKYDYTSKQQSTPSTTVSTTTTTEKPSQPTGKKMVNNAPEEEYYEDEEEYEYEEPKPAAKSKPSTDYDFPTGYEDTRRYMNRHRGRMPARKRAEMYDDYDAKERPSRINRRKEYNTRYEGERPRNARPMAHRNKNSRHEEEPHRYGQPMSGSGYKKRVMEPEYRGGTGRRAQEPKRPSVEDDYYYDEEEPEEAPPKRNRRPNQKVYEKAKPVSKQPKERPQEDPVRSEESPLKYAKGFANTQRNPKVNAAENEVPKVSPIYNEISTTETINVRQSQKYPNTVKAVKIVNNSLKDEIDESIDTYAHTEAETKTSSTQMKPMAETPPPRYSNVVGLKTLSPQSHRSSDTYAVEGQRKDKKPIEYEERSVPNKTITPVRHFVVSSPRKPSHFASTSTHVNNNYRDDATPSRNSEEKPLLKLPDPIQKPVIGTNEYYKPLQYAHHNVSVYPSTNYRNYVIPVSHEQPKPNNIRPVKEEHLAPETLNAITNNNYYSTSFISEPKPFTNEAPKSTSQNQQNYRQEHRLYNTGGDRLYTTNSISFPPHPPSNYDITAPGPSAPGEEPTAPEKKYSDPPTYPASSSGDYDVNYNDALQPSTLHPIRRYPSTSFYQQSTQQHQQHHQPQQRNVAPNRSPSDYAFNESAFNSLSRSQTRYKK